MVARPLDLAAVLKRKIRPAFERVGITGVGSHTSSAPKSTAGTVLAELGEHQLTFRDYLRQPSGMHELFTKVVTGDQV